MTECARGLGNVLVLLVLLCALWQTAASSCGPARHALLSGRVPLHAGTAPNRDTSELGEGYVAPTLTEPSSNLTFASKDITDLRVAHDAE